MPVNAPLVRQQHALAAQALLVAQTELVLVLDGDMLLHSGLHASLAADAARCAGDGNGRVCWAGEFMLETEYLQTTQYKLHRARSRRFADGLFSLAVVTCSLFPRDHVCLGSWQQANRFSMARRGDEWGPATLHFNHEPVGCDGRALYTGKGQLRWAWCGAKVCGAGGGRGGAHLPRAAGAPGGAHHHRLQVRARCDLPPVPSPIRPGAISATAGDA